MFSFLTGSGLSRLGIQNPRKLTHFFLPLVILGLAGNRGFAAPVFTSPSTASVNEGVSAGTTVYTAVATESGNTLTYALTGTDAAAFTINSSSGVVTINSVPDFETKSSYNFTVKASDPGNAFSTQAVTINVNDLPPIISSSSSVSVNEGVPAGTIVYTAIAADPAGGTVTYALTGTDAAAFTINSFTGAVTFNSVPDFETKSSYSFTIKATDPAAAFSTIAVTINVNDLPPVISSSSSASINEGVPAGTTVYTATAADPAGGTVTYALTGTDAAAFTINSFTGAVTFNSVPDFETKSSYSFTIKASDSSGAFSTKAVTLTVNDLPPVITSSSSASINEGVPAGTTVYTAIATDPAGGTVTYALTGTDAAAFTINSTTGVVTVNYVPDFETKSSYSFNVRASDPGGLSSTKAVTIDVTDLPPVISSSSSVSINEGVPAGTTVYTAVAADPAGGTVTYALTGADAAAFTIDSTTGVVTINNVPDFEAQSSYSFTVKASDSSGQFSTRAVTVTVNQVIIVGTPPNLTGVSFSGDGEFEFQFTNLAGASFTVLASTNPTLPLSNWTVLSAITDSPPGHYQFSDPQTTNNPLRFYRVRSP